MSKFDDDVVRLAVRAYVLSLPLLGEENDLIPLIAANKAYFIEGGKVIQYMQAAGTALAQGALAYHGPPVQNLFLGLMPAGLANLPGQVDAKMRSEGIQMGQELLWLAKVLPQVALGNFSPYQTTPTPYRNQLIAWTMLINQTNPAMAQAIRSQMQRAQPLMEQVIYNYFSQLNFQD